jgi:L-ribulose-5-phosphate 4-epimerase
MNSKDRTAEEDIMPTASSTISDFAQEIIETALRAFAALRDTRTLSPEGTLTFVERVPGEQAVVSLRYPGPFAPDACPRVSAFDLEGQPLEPLTGGDRGGARYLPVFRAHPHITSVSHVHTPYLGAWSQSHRSLPIRYVPVQRWTRARELPIYIDRTSPESAFIIAALNVEPSLPAILEANGGSTVFGSRGLQALAETILLLEEGARLQAIAESLGGARDYGPGVLEQQWNRTGLAA